MIRAIYSIIGTLISPLIFLWLLRRAARGKELRARLHERFGYARIARPSGQLVWLHAASVGEAQSVLTLARAVLMQHPAAHLLITTGTVTSAALMAQQNLPRTTHQFIPVDTYAAVRRFLQHWKPDLALWVESEFWPQLLWQLRVRRIPALLINARISEKTAQNWQRFPRTIRLLLASFTAMYASSNGDAARLRSLGAVEVIEAGNLKYDAEPLPCDVAALAAMQQVIGDRPVWLAASTHADEELRIAPLHTRIANEFPNLLTIIVPRHAARGDAIAAALRERSITVAQRSKNESMPQGDGIYLADTMGELGLFFRLSSIVFLGGSLIPHGGHNPLEPARLQCAILTGVHTHNFAVMVRDMQAASAITVVQHETELAEKVAELLRNKNTCEAQGMNAYRFVESARGASAPIVQHINRLLGGT